MQKNHLQSNLFGNDDERDSGTEWDQKFKSKQSATRGEDGITGVRKDREQELSKLFGPSSKQIKGKLNKKLRKKKKQQKQQEYKQLKNKIEEYEKTVYDFLNDFSSSDYETVDEEELKKEEEREYSRNFK